MRGTTLTARRARVNAFLREVEPMLLPALRRNGWQDAQAAKDHLGEFARVIGDWSVSRIRWRWSRRRG